MLPIILILELTNITFREKIETINETELANYKHESDETNTNYDSPRNADQTSLNPCFGRPLTLVSIHSNAFDLMTHTQTISDLQIIKSQKISEILRNYFKTDYALYNTLNTPQNCHKSATNHCQRIQTTLNRSCIDYNGNDAIKTIANHIKLFALKIKAKNYIFFFEFFDSVFHILFSDESDWIFMSFIGRDLDRDALPIIAAIVCHGLRETPLIITAIVPLPLNNNITRSLFCFCVQIFIFIIFFFYFFDWEILKGIFVYDFVDFAVCVCIFASIVVVLSSHVQTSFVH